MNEMIVDYDHYIILFIGLLLFIIVLFFPAYFYYSCCSMYIVNSN